MNTHTPNKNIVLRNRTINMNKTSIEKKKQLITLINKVGYIYDKNKIKRVKKVFDFFISDCSYLKEFRNPRLLSVILFKLEEFSTEENWGVELSNKYRNLIFPKSAQFEYILLRYYIHNTPTPENKIKKERLEKLESLEYKICLHTPVRAFRMVMDFIGKFYFK